MKEKVWPERADWQMGGAYLGGPYTFMGIPASRDVSNADVAVIGLPLMHLPYYALEPVLAPEEFATLLACY